MYRDHIKNFFLLVTYIMSFRGPGHVVLRNSYSKTNIRKK